LPGDPALLWRLASKADADLLRRFTCAPPRPRRGLPNPEPYSREVQTWIRRDALRETNRDSRSHDQRLLLFFDAGELVAVAGHGRCPELARPTAPPRQGRPTKQPLVLGAGAGGLARPRRIGRGQDRR
jgi:hypothetical protein